MTGVLLYVLKVLQQNPKNRGYMYPSLHRSKRMKRRPLVIIDDGGISEPAQARRLIADGLSVTELQSALGCSAETAVEYFTQFQAGITPPKSED